MPHSLSAPGRPVNYLVIEDDQDHAEIILGVLGEHTSSHRAEHVADGAEALVYLERVKAGTAPTPDVILLDLKLPKVDGLEVLDHIKRDEVLCSIPVVVLTTSDAEVDRTKAYQSHANSYLVKPINFEKFEALIEELEHLLGQVESRPQVTRRICALMLAIWALTFHGTPPSRAAGRG